MRIAILAWGSLINELRELSITGKWEPDGVELPIEFGRISLGNRLTLVIQPDWDNVRTQYAVSSFETLQAARENLQQREGAPSLNNIGFFDFTTNTNHVRANNFFVIELLRQWNEAKKFDAILWSDFEPNFSERRNGNAFTVENIKIFFEERTDEERAAVENYIVNAPAQTTTRFRKELEKYFSDRQTKK